MDNPEEVLHILDEFAKLKPKDIPKELEDYLSYVARTGDPVYQWPLVKCLFREKLLRVITDFYESTALLNPPSPAADNFNYEAMKGVLLERLETFSNAPFTVQRLCELLTAPRKQYNRTDKFMRAIEKNILVVSTREPGSACRQDNAVSEPLSNGVVDGDSESLTLNQSVNNDTVHLEAESEAHTLNLNQIQENIAVESTLSEENHLDIDSNEVDVTVTKDIDPVSEELTNSSDEVVNDKLVSDTGAELEDESCVKQVDSEAHSSLVHQAEIVENVEPVDRIDCVSSAEQSDSDGYVDSTEHTVSVQDEVAAQVDEPSVDQEEPKLQQEEIGSLEKVLVSENDVVCESKIEETKIEQIGDAVEKSFVEESDVSCSSSDTLEWSNAHLGESVPEPDIVSTTEDISVASSSEIVQEPVLVEEPVDPCSSGDLKESLMEPEQSDVSEIISEKTEESVLSDVKDIDSSLDSTSQPENVAKEEDAVGTTGSIDTSDIRGEVVEDDGQEAEGQSSVVEETHRLEASSEETAEAVSLEESSVVEEALPEPGVKEGDIQVSEITPEEGSLDTKSVDVCNSSTLSTTSEIPKEAAQIVSDEAMDVDEANSCHSTEGPVEGGEMAVADQSEPMDSE